MVKKYSYFMFWKKILEKVLQNYKYFDLKLMYFFEKNLFRNIDIASSPITLDNFFKNMKNTIKNYLQFAKKNQIKTSNIEREISLFVEPIKRARIFVVSPFLKICLFKKREWELYEKEGEKGWKFCTWSCLI